MKHKITIVLAVALVVFASSFAFAASPIQYETQGVRQPSMYEIGSTVRCEGNVSYWGRAINATLELWQGGTLVASWSKTGTNSVTISETCSFTSGLSYTLKLSGTVDGVGFTPQSITKTLW